VSYVIVHLLVVERLRLVIQVTNWLEILIPEVRP
jgi:hypothetical protein